MNESEVTPEILDVLKRMDLFRGKGADDLIEWLGEAPLEGGAECAVREFSEFSPILKEGSFGNTFYILIRGSVEVRAGSEQRLLAKLGVGSFFGEMTLISGLPCSATVTPIESCTVIEVPRRAFEQSMKKAGSFRNVMDKAYLERALANHLRLIPEFAELDPETAARLVARAKLRIFSKDEVIVREGDQATAMFLIREGYVRVVKKLAGGEARTVAYLKDGSYFGETALLKEERRNATVIASGKVEAIEIAKSDFLELVSRYNPVAERFQEQIGAQEPTALGFVGEVLQHGLVKATSALVIHLDQCTRCGNCVKACAELHDGISRLTRRGTFIQAPAEQLHKWDPLLVTTSCMHCLDPECMIGCPTGAITRDVNGEVIIQDSCIGCGNCARRCPYGNISMAEVPDSKELQKQQTGAPLIGGYLQFWRTPDGEPMMHEIEKGTQTAVVRRLAVKCDLCQEFNYNHGCVHNCPYGAIERIEPRAYLTAAEPEK